MNQVIQTSRVNQAVFASCLLLVSFWISPARASAQEVSVDYDKRADLSKCATYAWAKGQPARDPLIDKHIIEAIDEALAAKGSRKVEENPGCYVRYQASAREQRGLQIWDSGGRFMGGMGSVDVKTVRAGMLVVDLLDAATRELVWRAVARDTLSDKTDKNAKKLAKATKKMFEDFPPESEAR